MNFDDLIGNEAIKKNLSQAIENNTISNALLFSGPDAIGKSQFARILAGYLMYPRDININKLKKIKCNNHPDLYLLQPEGKTSLHSIESVRNLNEQVFMAPFEAKSKVFIIKDAHRMLKSSSNALLKTLEEPTLDSFIILITSKVEEILPTIVSRCFRFNFSSIKDEEIISFLQEKYFYEKKDALKLAKIANGSIGRAIELAKHSDYLTKRDLLIKILAKENISTYIDFSDALSSLEEMYAQKFKENLAHEEIDILIENILFWFRDLHLLKIKKDEKYIFFSDKLDLLKKQNLDNLVSLDALIKLIDEVKLALSRNIKLKHALENFFLKIDFGF